jgi:hypothetical protein
MCQLLIHIIPQKHTTRKKSISAFILWNSDSSLQLLGEGGGDCQGVNGRFKPNEPISRQDMAAIIARYAQDVAKATLPQNNAPITFTDEDKSVPMRQTPSARCSRPV